MNVDGGKIATTVRTRAWTSGWGRCDNKCPESVALYIWHRRIIELIVFGMTGRESGERSAVPECSLILFSIHCAQRLEAPEGSPARSLDALSHTLRQRDRTGGPLRGVGQERVGSTTQGRRHSGEWVGWVGGLVGGAQTVGSAGDAACLPACSGASAQTGDPLFFRM